jgi:hypothetical protein
LAPLTSPHPDDRHALAAALRALPWKRNGGVVAGKGAPARSLDETASYRALTCVSASSILLHGFKESPLSPEGKVRSVGSEYGQNVATFSLKERCTDAAGLTTEETIEFEALDALPPFDDSGNIAWVFEGEPTTRREKRWLQLY